MSRSQMMTALIALGVIALVGNVGAVRNIVFPASPRI